MRKLFWHSGIIAVVLMLGTNLAKAEKITIEQSENPDIEKITIDNDILTIKTKDQELHFKLSELVEKTSQAKPNPTPKNLTEAFAFNGKWYFFDNKDNTLNRLQYAYRNKYKVFKEGELLQEVTYKGKSYARDLKGNVFIPHWEINNDFDTHLVPATKYINKLKKALESYKKKFSEINTKITNIKKSIKEDRKQYIKLLQTNNLSTTMVDSNGNIITTYNSQQHSLELKRQLRLYNKNIKKQEHELSQCEKQFKFMKSNINRFEKQLRNLESLYQQYCQK